MATVKVDTYMKARIERLHRLLSADIHEMEDTELRRHVSSAEDLVHRLRQSLPLSEARIETLAKASEAARQKRGSGRSASDGNAPEV